MCREHGARGQTPYRSTKKYAGIETREFEGMRLSSTRSTPQVPLRSPGTCCGRRGDPEAPRNLISCSRQSATTGEPILHGERLAGFAIASDRVLIPGLLPRTAVTPVYFATERFDTLFDFLVK